MQYASTLILSIHLHFSRFQGWWRCLPWNRAGGRVPDLHQAAQHSCPAKQWHLGQCHGLVDGPQWWVQGGINVSAINSSVHSDQSGNKLQDFLGKLSFMPRSLEFWKVQLDTWVSEKKWYNLYKRCDRLVSIIFWWYIYQTNSKLVCLPKRKTQKWMKKILMNKYFRNID